MNRNRKKAAAATLAAGMAVVLGAGTVMAAASTGDNGLQKEETVYVNTTAGGEVTDVTVSDWLKNSGDSSNSEVKDASDLQDIKNVKGDETFTQNGMIRPGVLMERIFIIRERQRKISRFP